MKQYVLGLDFGSDSVRAIVVDVKTGEELSSAVCCYERWLQGQYCNPKVQQFRQHPQDYIDSMVQVIQSACEPLGEDITKNIIGIGIDTTGSTPCPVNEAGVPLALIPEFAENPNAMFHLWKDHTSIAEAEVINAYNLNQTKDYLSYVGGIYSSEWYWAKIMHTSKQDSSIRLAAKAWVEHCDWIPFLLTGLPKLPVARVLWDPKPNLEISATAWIHAGGAHHTVYSQNLGVEAMEDFATILGTEFLVIDADTKIRSFKNEIKWNAASF